MRKLIKEYLKYLSWVPIEMVAMYTLVAANTEQWNPGLWQLEIKVMFWIVSAVVLIAAIIIKNQDI